MALPEQTGPTASAKARSLISADLTITGTIRTEGEVHVAGRVEGNIHATRLVLEENGFVAGDVFAQDAVIRGRLEGGVRARKVQLAPGSYMRGDILHARQLSIDSGADFEGSARAADDPLGDGRVSAKVP